MLYYINADHENYKKLGLYDFPKKSFQSRILRVLFKSKKFRKMVYKDNRMLKNTIKPHQKIINKLELTAQKS